MSDLSEIEGKYFIDGTRYNCPFCNVRAAKYSVVDDTSYNKSLKEKVCVYIVECDLCGARSIHLSNWYWGCTDYNERRHSNPFTNRPDGLDSTKYPDYRKNIEHKLDIFFFYHFPTSFFTIDENIPKEIRELVTEAEGCKEMNFLVGASGALRKAIYKLLKHEKAAGENYEDKIKWLKDKYPGVEDVYIDALGNIKDMNDQTLHEDDWEPFTGPEFTFLVESMKGILNQIYVEPLKRKKMLEKVLSLKTGRKKVEEEK